MKPEQEYEITVVFWVKGKGPNDAQMNLESFLSDALKKEHALKFRPVVDSEYWVNPELTVLHEEES